MPFAERCCAQGFTELAIQRYLTYLASPSAAPVTSLAEAIEAHLPTCRRCRTWFVLLEASPCDEPVLPVM